MLRRGGVWFGIDAATRRPICPVRIGTLSLKRGTATARARTPLGRNGKERAAHSFWFYNIVSSLRVNGWKVIRPCPSEEKVKEQEDFLPSFKFQRGAMCDQSNAYMETFSF